MKRVLVVVAAVLVALGASVGAYALTTNHRTPQAEELSGYFEVAPNASPGSGSFRLRIDEAAQKITYRLTYSGLEAPAVVAHIHFGQPDVNGGVMVFADVVGPAVQGIDPGSFDEAVQVIRDGMTYVNVHSEKYPAGEIRAPLGEPRRGEKGRR
jgi:hypothetical protein